RQGFQHHVGQAVDVARRIAHRRHDDDVSGRQTGGDLVLVQYTGQNHARTETPVGYPGVELVSQVAVAGQDQPKALTLRRQPGDRVDEVLESLLAHEAT